MSYFEEYFSENDEVVAEIVNIAKGLVSAEIKDKLTNQENTIKELEEELNFYKNYQEEKKSLDRELAKIKRESEAAYNKGYEECKKKRLQNLLDLQHYWVISYEMDYINPKCDKCDDNRNIHFFSPSGKELEEKCECGKTHKHFLAKQSDMVSMIFGYHCNDGSPARYYAKPAYKEYGRERQVFEFESNRIWVYENADTLEHILKEHSGSEKQYYNFTFESEKDAQKYADWLNENYG